MRRGRNRQQRISLKALSRVIQKFFGGIATLFCGALHHSRAIVDRIGNCVRRARSPTSRICDVSSRFFHNRL
jgi:hypothetical protein